MNGDPTPLPEDERVPYVCIGNDELSAPIGETVTCPHCDGTHAVRYGERVLPDGRREPSKLLGFYDCGGKTYLCAVDGRSVMNKFRSKQS